MSTTGIYQNRFKALNCCIIVPTYNNQGTLASVLEDLLVYTNQIIVLNDGSTDNTKNILKNFDAIEIRNFEKNRGKGVVLKKGFKIAEELGYDYAITIDSDGQHYPDDLDVFLTELEKRNPGDKELLLIGDRNMGSDGVPGKSATGNDFSSYWYLVVTGFQLHDTQSGYRLYPLKVINSVTYYTWKFEFEIEIIVKASWRKVDVKNVPIKVLYDEKNRVSHFRPFWDIVRITLLYMWFVLVSFFWIHPRNKYRDFKQKGFKRFWKEDIIKSNDSPAKKATAIAVGIFVGLSPFWGIHTFLVFVLAAFLKVNKIIAFLFSNISIPPFIPVIVYLSFQVGSVILGNGWDWSLKLEKISSTTDVFLGLGQYIFGSLILAITASILVWIVFYLLFSVLNKKQIIKS
ncbi:DUF2062 domain-containing protein [Zunongwangia sp. HRR-M8]|uniref:DUF2062 domain-containing protein n=1 Tax=Zunongwangia sp. HRR-M8 TaxID=3015170 RepID=UPI0022DE4F4D|nr:DUF2062 domain-containing protein [Zunongwangia sp. HRR-M8]WBL20844.1 DUF2062 domain-containing protein [Zunongwangia sp. HRR-M8]